MRYTRGTNQYKSRYKSTWKRTLWVFTTSVLTLCAVSLYYQKVGLAEGLTVMEPNIVSPLPHTLEIVPSQPPLAPVSERFANSTIIRKIWGKDAHTGIAIATCESGLRSNAVNRHNTNGSVDIGLFQVNSIHGWSEAQMLDPIANAGVAYAMFEQQGLNPWSSSKHCWEAKL